MSQPPSEGGSIGSSAAHAASPAPPAAAPRASRRQPAAAAARPAPPTHAEVGLALVVIRQWRGLTQRALAAKTHTSPALLSRYETAKVDMNLSSLMKILDALDVEPEYFFRVARALPRQLSREQPAEIEPVDLRRALHQLHGAIDDLRQLVDRFAAGGRVNALIDKILGEREERRSPP